MATSLIGPIFEVANAFAAAPVPRPPQPIKASWRVLSSAAWTCGMAIPAKAEAAAIRPVVFRNSRREVTLSWLFGLSFISYTLLTATAECQFKKFWRYALRDHPTSLRQAIP